MKQRVNNKSSTNFVTDNDGDIVMEDVEFDEDGDVTMVDWQGQEEDHQ